MGMRQLKISVEAPVVLFLAATHVASAVLVRVVGLVLSPVLTRVVTPPVSFHVFRILL